MRDKVKLCPSQNVNQNFQGVSNKKSFAVTSKIHRALQQAEYTKTINGCKFETGSHLENI